MTERGGREREIERERERSRERETSELIKENPYLDYNFVSNDPILKRHQSLEQYADHGDINHDLIK